MLLNHGLFTFADDARTAYERMIAGVDRAERFVARAGAAASRADRRGAGRRREPAVARRASAPRCCAARWPSPSGNADHPWQRMILEHRVERRDRWRCSRAPTPRPLAAREPAHARPRDPHQGPGALRAALPLDDDADARRLDEARRRPTATRYDAYFAAHAATGPRTPVTQARPQPRASCWCPASGIFGAGAHRKDDARIAADIAEHTLRAKALGDALGALRRRCPTRDLFDMEYWSLEQAKLGKDAGSRSRARWRWSPVPPARSASASASSWSRPGAHVVLTDVDRRAPRAPRELDPKRRRRRRRRRHGRDRRGVGDGRRSPRPAGSSAASTSCVLNAGIAHVSALDGDRARRLPAGDRRQPRRLLPGAARGRAPPDAARARAATSSSTRRRTCSARAPTSAPTARRRPARTSSARSPRSSWPPPASAST